MNFFIVQNNVYLRNNELNIVNEKLKIQLVEKEKTVSNIQKSMVALEERLSSNNMRQAVDMLDAAEDGGQPENSQNVEAMHDALRKIAQEVINDCDRMDDISEQEIRSSIYTSHRSTSKSPLRTRSASRSPSRGRSMSPTFADTTFAAVQAAIHKRSMQVAELRAKLTSSHDQNVSLKKQLDDLDNERRRQERVIMSTKEERDDMWGLWFHSCLG